ncbi:MAG TPA: TIM-barrel domain-containing protein [Candidatus Binatia bacterium]|jgi:alpha-glucosidase (family GH31 glycosyl hydrolase)|nr:TIM-barrel domain-containing protein [Candidatus Binatia bacterium]
MRTCVPTLAAVLCLAATASAAVGVDIGASTVRVTSPVARVEIGRHPFRLAVRERDRGRVLLREHPKGGLFWERGATTHALGDVGDVLPLADGVQLTVDTDEGTPATVTVRFLTDRTVEVALDPPSPASVTAFGERLRSPRQEAIYGLTERLRDGPVVAPGVLDAVIEDFAPPEVGSLDRRGETVEMRVLPTFSVYAPFFQSSRGYGLGVAGTTFGLFDLAKTEPQTVSFRFEAGASQRLVYQVFVGPEYATILDEYTALNGRPYVPPDWAFLHWRWRGELATGAPALLDGTLVNAQLAEDVTMYDTLGIPAGVYLFDRPVLAGNFGFARWEWDAVRLPNIDAALTSLRDRGYHLGTWSSTWTCGNGPLDHGTEAQALGYLVPGPGGPPNCADIGGTGFILDPTNPDARAWWRDQITPFMATYGIQAIKLDRGEEHIPSAATDVYADGRTGREVRNDYPRLQAEIHHDALAAAFPGGDYLVMSRPGYTGTSQWAIFWGGDIPGSTNLGNGPGTDLGLRSAIISQQRAAFMGIPIWGSDTGGYYEFKDREVFARWLAFSAFSGIMEIGGVGAHAPWDMPTEPHFDTELIDIYRKYTQLRVTLQPYVTAAAQQAASGMPIVRPMPFADRRDRRLVDLWDQYLFGPDLLVAPVWKVGQRSREVYLPRGTWRSYWNPSQVFQGRRRITVDVALDAIPVFVRDGAVVPGP